MLAVLTSCTSTQKSAPSNTAPETIVPDPLAEGSTMIQQPDGTVIINDINGLLVMRYDPSTKTVTMAEWYYKKIVRYIIDTQTAEDIAAEK